LLCDCFEIVAIALRLLSDRLTIVLRFFCNCLVIAKRLLGNCSAGP
jgi:hypothetical protein